MDDEIVDLHVKSKDEEPWCSICSRFSDFRRKWSTVSRADLDGGCYSENSETPHCETCGSPMHDLRLCSKLTRVVHLLVSLHVVISGLVCFWLFDPSVQSGVVFVIFVVCGLFFLGQPRGAQRALKTHREYLRERNLELTRKLFDSNKQNRSN